VPHGAHQTVSQLGGTLGSCMAPAAPLHWLLQEVYDRRSKLLACVTHTPDCRACSPGQCGGREDKGT
jgi:hypothetical protein